MDHWNLYNPPAATYLEFSLLNDLASRFISDAFLVGELPVVQSACTMGCDSCGVAASRSPSPVPESDVAVSTAAVFSVCCLVPLGAVFGLPLEFSVLVFLRVLFMEALIPSKYPEIP